MKGLLKFLFGLLVFLLITVVIPVGFLYYKVSDNRDLAPTELYTEDVSVQSLLTQMMADALESTDDKIYFGMNEEELDLLLLAMIREQFNPTYYKTENEEDQYIQKMVIPEGMWILSGKEVILRHAYATISGTEISVYVTAEALGIKTSLNFGLSITEAEGAYTITATRLGIGKLNVLSGLAKMFLPTIMSALDIGGKIEKVMTDSNLPGTFDVNTLSYTITSEEMGQFLVNLAASGESGTQNELLGELVSVLTASENELFGIGVFENDAESIFGAYLDITNAMYDALTDGTPTYILDYTDFQAKMAALVTVNGGENFALMSKFMLYGYANLTVEEQAIIDGLDFTGVPIPDVTVYVGLVDKTVPDLEQNISDDLYAELGDLTDAAITLNIDEDFINQILWANGLVGLGYNTFYEDEGVNKVVYAGVEAIWIDVVDNELGFKLVFNLNGRRICLFTNFIDQSTVNAKIEANFDELRMGTIVFSDSMKASILALLGDSLGGTDMTVITVADNKITIDSNTFLEEFNDNSLLGSLLGIIKNEDMLGLELTGATMDANGAISFEIDLTKIQSEEDVTATLLDAATPFNVTTFIENKTQTFIISGLTGGENTLTFSNSDFNRLLYQETNGYDGFSNVTTLPDGVTTFTYEVTGVFLEFGITATTIKFVVEINGLQTVIIIETAVVTTPAEDQITLVMGDNITLGTVSTPNDFLLDLLGANISNLGIMTYEASTQSLIIEKEVFQDFMTIGGPATPLNVDKIRIVDGAFEVIVTFTDPALGTLIDTVTDAIESALGDDFLNETGFDVTDPDQQAAVDALSDTLTDIQTVLNDPGQTLTEEDTQALVDAINELDEANQQEFLDQLETQANAAELAALYDALFGN